MLLIGLLILVFCFAYSREDAQFYRLKNFSEQYHAYVYNAAGEKLLDESSTDSGRLLAFSMLMIGLLLTLLIFTGNYASLQKNVNKILSDRVLEKTMELNSFLYRISHDLAGPLATMKGLIKLADSNNPSGNISCYIEKMKLTVSRQEKIINRLGAISRINTTQLRPESVELITLIDGVIHTATNGYPVYPEIKIQGKQTAFLDKELFCYILQSLLENSFGNIDPREENPRIQVEIFNGKKLDVLICDTGTGIINGQESRIFDLFFSGTDKNERTGMGLYYAKVAAERLGGQIFLRNNRKPTIFEVTLPTGITNFTFNASKQLPNPIAPLQASLKFGKSID
jgi:signal transduction histidine kinase